MSNKKRIIKKVEEISLPILQQLNFELVDIEFEKQGSNWYLRIFIDKPEGITIDDCQLVSEKIGKCLDDIDPIEQSYFLEVSSPGLDRPLKKDKDLKKHLGDMVEVKTYKPVDGIKNFKGILKDFSDKSVFIETEEGKITEIDRALISTIRLAISF
jgi:ribosome maturation factor RimP